MSDLKIDNPNNHNRIDSAVQPVERDESSTKSTEFVDVPDASGISEHIDDLGEYNEVVIQDVENNGALIKYRQMEKRVNMVTVCGSLLIFICYIWYAISASTVQVPVRDYEADEYDLQPFNEAVDTPTMLMVLFIYVFYIAINLMIVNTNSFRKSCLRELDIKVRYWKVFSFVPLVIAVLMWFSDSFIPHYIGGHFSSEPANTILEVILLLILLLLFMIVKKFVTLIIWIVRCVSGKS